MVTSALNWPARDSLIDGIEGCGLDGEGGAAAADLVELSETMLLLLKRRCFRKAIAPFRSTSFTFESAVEQH